MITTERESTVWVRWPLTISWGDLADLDEIQVAAVADPDERPTAWVDATIIDTTHPLWRGSREIAVRVGPTGGDRPADLVHDGPGVMQLWTRWQSADEAVTARSAMWEVT